MRQFNYWGGWEDSLAMVAAMLETNRVRAFVDAPHEQPRVEMYSTLHPDLVTRMRERGGVELWDTTASTTPLVFGRWEAGVHAGRHYVKGGGPFLSFTLAKDYDENEETLVTSGHIVCDRTYFDPETSRELPVPARLVETYEQMVKIIRANCVRIGPKRRWVGTIAARLIEQGVAVIRSPGFY